MGRREPKTEAIEALQNMSAGQLDELNKKLSSDGTETELGVCEWRALLEPLDGYKPMGKCHQSWMDDPEQQSFRDVPDKCPYCSRSIRIVEDDNA